MTTKDPISKDLVSDVTVERALSASVVTLDPSSGFAESVMAAVWLQASTRAPIAFPWKRALPGLAAALMVVALLTGWICTGLVLAYRLPAQSMAWQQMSPYQSAAASIVLPLVFETILVIGSMAMLRPFNRFEGFLGR